MRSPTLRIALRLAMILAGCCTQAVSAADAIPPGAAALGYSKCVMNERPVSADIATGENGKFKWFSGQWWDAARPLSNARWKQSPSS